MICAGFDSQYAPSLQCFDVLEARCHPVDSTELTQSAAIGTGAGIHHGGHDWWAVRQLQLGCKVSGLTFNLFDRMGDAKAIVHSGWSQRCPL